MPFFYIRPEDRGGPSLHFRFNHKITTIAVVVSSSDFPKRVMILCDEIYDDVMTKQVPGVSWANFVG